MWQSDIYPPSLGSYSVIGNTWAYVELNVNAIFITGVGIRPCKLLTELKHGETGTYVGNDSKVYRTICIGNIEWLADNLAETKCRNGDLIPEVTDNAAWAALTTGALCAYNNDWNNV